MIVMTACSFTSEAPDSESNPTWVDAWEAAPSGVVPHRCSGSSPISAFPGNEARSQTLRFSIRPSVEGTAIRVRLTNRLSDAPLAIRHVTVGTNRDVLFENRRAFTIPANADAISDSVVTDVDPDRLLTISIAVASGGPLTWHADGPAAVFASRAGTGDLTTAAASRFTSRLLSAPVLNGLQVRKRRPTTAIAAIGDSLTEAGTSAPQDHWLDILGDRLERSGVTRALINAGITCNRLLRATPAGGPAASERFAFDVLNREGVSHVILFEGTNDLSSSATADQLIAAITDLAQRARRAGIKPIGATLFPTNGPSSTQHASRRALNRWIRTTDELDGYLDFDRVIRDPANPDRINPRYNADGIHVNARGRRAMGKAINLSLFS
jgi:lysophospholipase L1-like esterase